MCYVSLVGLTLALTCACWRDGRLTAVSEKLERGQSVEEPFVGGKAVSGSGTSI